jgi:hypothetical protein
LPVSLAHVLPVVQVGEVVYRQADFGFLVRLTESSEMQRRQFNALMAYAKAAATKPG